MSRAMGTAVILGVLLTAPVGAWASGERFELGAGFLPDPQLGSGTAGGDRQASALSSTCAGTISSTPNHVLVVTSEVNLEIWVESSADATLVIQGNGTTLCADSGHGGTNPSVTRVFEPGTWQVFVGSKTGAAPYELGVTEAL